MISVDLSSNLASKDKIDEKLDNVTSDVTSKTSSIGDNEEEKEECEVKEVELLELVAEKETSTEHTLLSADSKPELPLEQKEQEREGEELQGNMQDATQNSACKEEVETKKEDNEIEEEQVYEVEKIVGHKLYKGNVTRYEIKWKGYPSSENTFERASSIHDDVPELCIEYWNSINVPRPSNVPNQPYAVKVEVTKGEGQPLSGKRVHEEEDDESTASKKPKDDIMQHIPSSMLQLGYAFPTEQVDWHQGIKKLCVQGSPRDAKTIHAFIEWDNGKKWIHDIKTVHNKIPEKLFAYYEERLHFV